MNETRVCPHCGDPAAAHRFCPTCGLNMSELSYVPTHDEWVAARLSAIAAATTNPIGLFMSEPVELKKKGGKTKRRAATAAALAALVAIALLAGLASSSSSKSSASFAVARASAAEQVCVDSWNHANTNYARRVMTGGFRGRWSVSVGHAVAYPDKCLVTFLNRDLHIGYQVLQADADAPTGMWGVPRAVDPDKLADQTAKIWNASIKRNGALQLD